MKYPIISDEVERRKGRGDVKRKMRSYNSVIEPDVQRTPHLKAAGVAAS
jgi:hypothetical protein